LPAQQELFRNDDKIDLEIRTGSTEGIMVIPVSVQVLVENALKHNACFKEQAGTRRDTGKPRTGCRI